MATKRNSFLLVFSLIIVYLLYKSISSSLIFKAKDRVNIVFYGQNTTFFSLGLNDTNYLLPFTPEVEVLIPGGYGYYKVGALGKLIKLERKQELFKKIFTSNTFSIVNLYFFSQNPTIYYQKDNSSGELPTFKDIFFTSSNANVFDRIFIFFAFFGKKKNHFRTIKDLPVKREADKYILDQDGFFKLYQGYFYKKPYRNEKTNVQIIYTKSYKTAVLISRILEGEGIRVVDLTKSDENYKNCRVVEKETNYSQISLDISRFFGCQLTKGKTELSDIIFVLGTIENDWLVE